MAATKKSGTARKTAGPKSPRAKPQDLKPLLDEIDGVAQRMRDHASHYKGKPKNGHLNADGEIIEIMVSMAHYLGPDAKAKIEELLDVYDERVKADRGY